LISYCVEEEERLKTEKMKDVINMVGNLSLVGTPKNQHESGSIKQDKRKHPKKNGNKSSGPKNDTKLSVAIRKRMAKCSTSSANHLSTCRRHVQVLRNGANSKVTFGVTLYPLLMNYS
jgi:hypothetical protein